jgi:peptide/nickel transport system permease protein
MRKNLGFLYNNKPLWIGGLMLLFLFLLATIGPSLPFVEQEPEKELFRYENQRLIVPPFSPSTENVMGTDGEGRDLLSMIVAGTKETLLIVFIITILRYVIAIPLAITASNQSGIMYWILNGWSQLFSGLPTLFAAILLINLPFITISDNRTIWIILIIAILEVGRVGYIFQQQAFGLSQMPFVESGRMIGNGKLGIYLRYYWPYLFPQIIVNFVLDLGRVMLLLGQLGFFNMFVSQDLLRSEAGNLMIVNTSHDWPTLLADSRLFLRSEIWVPFWPAFAIAFSVIAFNLFGEGLRRYFEGRSSSQYNPKLEERVIKEIELEKAKAEERKRERRWA